MALVSKPERLLWFIGAALCVAGFLGWIWAYVIWDQYLHYLPRSPNPTTGSIYALNIHGIVVYQTLKQQSRRESWEFWSYGTCCCGAALAAIYQWRARRRAAKTQ
jgi:hypothetical protein